MPPLSLDPFYVLHTVLPATLSLGQVFTLRFTYAANSTGIDQPSIQTNLFSVLTTNTSTMLMTTIQRDNAYNYTVMLSATQQFLNENILISYNGKCVLCLLSRDEHVTSCNHVGSSVFFSPVINVSVTSERELIVTS